MNLVENFSLITNKHHEMAMTKTENSENFITPKISSSVSFNSLAKVKIRNRTKSPLVKEKSHDYSNFVSPGSQQITSKFKQGNNAPKVSKKLPPAFGTIFQKSSSKMSRKPVFEPTKDNSEPLPAIEQMIGAQEYKHTAGLLSPLKPKNVKNQIDDSQRLIQKKQDRHESKRHKNPLLPLKNYLLLSKMNDERKDVNNLSLEKLDKLYKVTKDNLFSKKESSTPKEIRPNEMITFNVIKSSHESGTVKKLLHAPSLRLFAVKEVPLGNREVRNSLKEWLALWQSNFEDSKHHVKVHTTSFNSPEGCLSIFMELLNAASLQNLLESVGNLPESIIRSIASQLLVALDEVHSKTQSVYGGLSPSQILVDKEGNIKLSLGLSNKIQATNNNNNYNTLNRNSVCEKTSLYEMTPINNPGSFQKHLAVGKDTNGFAENRHFAFSQDIFEFGYLMLVCAVGGLDFYESADFADKIKLFLEEMSKKPQERQKYCCIIHNEEIISSIRNAETNLFNNRPVRVQKGNGIVIDKNSKSNALVTIQDFLLTQNFSKDFVKFLCGCLKFDPTERHSIKSLLNSPFIQNQDPKGPSVSLPELLKISIQWSKNLVLPQEYQGPSERQLHKLCESLSMVLPNCDGFMNSNRGYENLRELNVNSSVIQNLADELGLPAVKVWTEINKTVKVLCEN